ncbi:Ribosomal protein S18 acetylase RimI [Thermoactinomyces sp. DSM 45891]|uniref:GNAT family N-acetyltransferase n=1 Tax=Thermoactinomyces sp. DSM 45891 TaxID=1761907 RepID=UPI00090F40BD|nr:GNAT family N-acetyltransferase [Thermoactinomyces sp. DSM 45891]SFX52477.1 Ribosomal protein S18 acetylase RimI [Thermoactinomyces sp. DSM 45891]
MIYTSEKHERDFIEKRLGEYNQLHVPITASPIGFHMKDSVGSVIGGINGIVYWKERCLFITVCWIDEKGRGDGWGSRLLRHIEDNAREKGCKMAHLDTFDFQAKGFYLKNGYEIFGVLDYPDQHTRYYLKKQLM